MLFKDEYDFLSNFYQAPMLWHGAFWPTVEHAFQAAKCVHPEDEEIIRACSTPGKAKVIGRSVLLRPDWEKVKVDVMTELVILKFNPARPGHLAAALRATETMPLEEGNYWHDNFWGNCYCDECLNKPGENVLGIILMEVRKDLRDGN